MCFFLMLKIYPQGTEAHSFFWVWNKAFDSMKKTVNTRSHNSKPREAEVKAKSWLDALEQHDRWHEVNLRIFIQPSMDGY